MSEAVRRSGAANDRRKRARLRFPLPVRDERALHGCERALVADTEPQRLLLFRIGGLLCSRSLVAATGDGCTVRANESLNRRFAVRVSVNG